MMAPAPGRLSTITCWPMRSVSFCATIRPTMSVAPPTAQGMMERIGLLRSDDGAGPRPVVDNHLLADAFGELLRDDPPHDVGSAAHGPGNDGTDRSAQI